MSTGKHYFIEKNEEGKFKTTAKGGAKPSGVFDTQREAIDYAKELNPDDHPDVERVRKLPGSRPGEWRSGRGE
jgi:hypothetical protein